MPTVKNLESLIINKVESKEAYNYMVANGLINDDELYLTPDGAGVPECTTTDNGKVLSVVNGEAAWDELPAGTPECTTADNGKFLRVVNGEAAWATIPSAEEASF